MLLHDFHDVKKGSHRCIVDETITVDSPPSIVLTAIERYFDVRGNDLDLILPRDIAGNLCFCALYAKVAVTYQEHPNPAIVGRYDDRLVVRFSMGEDEPPLFDGRFTIKPLGTRTELQLKGRFALSPDLVHYASSSDLLEVDIVAFAMRIFLRELRAVIEAEFETFKVACRPVACVKSARDRRLVSL